MKALKTLLKVASRDLETLRRELAEKSAQQGLAEESLRALQQNILAEQQSAAKDYEATRAYAGYAIHAMQRRGVLAQQITSIAAECDELRRLITEAHVEMRKFERLIELQTERELKEADKREAAELDEIATQRAGRAQRG